jgi:uncharacterized protein involved in outer membrane biogenesis
MHNFASTFRHLLRRLAVMAACLAAGMALLAAALPSLIGAKAIQNSFTRALSAWSGGPVAIGGPLNIASFIPLSIEAPGVRFAPAPRLAPAIRIEAKTVTATARLEALLSGRLEFKTIAIESPKIVLARKDFDHAVSFHGIETAARAAAFTERNVFEHLEISNPVIAVAAGKHAAYRRVAIQRVRLDRGFSANGSAPPITHFYLRQEGLEVSFLGRFDARGEAASGSLRVNAVAGHAAAASILQALTPWERKQSIAISGDLGWSGSRVSLENAKLSFSNHSAGGSLALAVRHGRPLLEGTLSYDQLELAGAPAGQGPASIPLRALAAGLYGLRANLNPDLDLDIRISADGVSGGLAGALALGLTSRAGHLIVDVAELNAFGGTISGRADYDPRRPSLVSVTMNGSLLDSSALARAAGLSFGVGGPASLSMAADFPVSAAASQGDAVPVSGTFSIGFPAGGTLSGDVSHQLSAALESRDVFWGLGAASFSFTTATVEGQAAASGITLKVDGEHDGKRITGSLLIASPDNTVSGLLSLSEAKDAADSVNQDTPAGPSRTANLLFSGTIAALNISSGKSSLSN